MDHETLGKPPERAFNHELLNKEIGNIMKNFQGTLTGLEFLNKGDSPFHCDELNQAIIKVKEAISWFERLR